MAWLNYKYIPLTNFRSHVNEFMHFFYNIDKLYQSQSQTCIIFKYPPGLYPHWLTICPAMPLSYPLITLRGVSASGSEETITEGVVNYEHYSTLTLNNIDANVKVRMNNNFKRRRISLSSSRALHKN